MPGSEEFEFELDSNEGELKLDGRCGDWLDVGELENMLVGTMDDDGAPDGCCCSDWWPAVC